MEYCLNRSLRLSNHNKEFIWYRVLIGCFILKYEYKYMLKSVINIRSEGDQRHQLIEKDKITVNEKKNKEKRNSLILNTENYKTTRTTSKNLKWNKVPRKGKSSCSIICSHHVNDIQNVVNRHNLFRGLRYFWDELQGTGFMVICNMMSNKCKRMYKIKHNIIVLHFIAV